MRYISEENLRKHIISEGCDEGCGYIDERDLPNMEWEGWTPISDEPKTAAHILVSTDTRSVFELDYAVTKHDAKVNPIAKQIIDSIVGWMPMPKPYEPRS